MPKEYLDPTAFGNARKALWRLRRILDETMLAARKMPPELAYVPESWIEGGWCHVADAWVNGQSTFVMVGIRSRDDLLHFRFESAGKRLHLEEFITTPYFSILTVNTPLPVVLVQKGPDLRLLRPGNNAVEPCEFSGRIAAGTLCRDDYRNLPPWMIHNERLGVKAHYIYYNGPVPRGLIRRLRKHNARLIPWRMDYFNPNSVSADHRPDWHHGQMIQLGHLLWRFGKPRHDWLLSADLDEYITFKKGEGSLAALVLKCERENVSGLTFHNVWITGDNRVVDLDEPKRVKQLSRTTDFDFLDVHATVREGIRVDECDEAFLAHRFSLSNPWRRFGQGKTSLEEFFRKYTSKRPDLK